MWCKLVSLFIDCSIQKLSENIWKLQSNFCNHMFSNDLRHLRDKFKWRECRVVLFTHKSYWRFYETWKLTFHQRSIQTKRHPLQKRRYLSVLKEKLAMIPLQHFLKKIAALITNHAVIVRQYKKLKYSVLLLFIPTKAQWQGVELRVVWHWVRWPQLLAWRLCIYKNLKC